jgi:HEAT repeat protein
VSARGKGVRNLFVALGPLRDPQAGEALAAALADRDGRVRRAAARAIGAYGGAQAIEALDRTLREERVPGVRRMAAYALSRMADQAALDVLDGLRADPDPTVRALAELALARGEP